MLGIFLLGTTVLTPSETLARNPSARMGGTTFTLALENDIVARTDYEYTHGIKLTWVPPDLSRPGNPDAEPSALLRLPLMREPGYRRNISISLGQTIFTPRNIEYPDLIKHDRPYSGITCASLGIHRTKERGMDTLEITMGIIGPHSYGGYLQDRTHDIFSADEPHGWRNQLDDEILLNIFLGRKWRAILCQTGGQPEIDILPISA